MENDTLHLTVELRDAILTNITSLANAVADVETLIAAGEDAAGAITQLITAKDALELLSTDLESLAVMTTEGDAAGDDVNDKTVITDAFTQAFKENIDSFFELNAQLDSIIQTYVSSHDRKDEADAIGDESSDPIWPQTNPKIGESKDEFARRMQDVFGPKWTIDQWETEWGVAVREALPKNFDGEGWST